MIEKRRFGRWHATPTATETAPAPPASPEESNSRSYVGAGWQRRRQTGTPGRSALHQSSRCAPRRSRSGDAAYQRTVLTSFIAPGPGPTVTLDQGLPGPGRSQTSGPEPEPRQDTQHALQAPVFRKRCHAGAGKTFLPLCPVTLGCYMPIRSPDGGFICTGRSTSSGR
jgi:hypothetical protein